MANSYCPQFFLTKTNNNNINTMKKMTKKDLSTFLSNTERILLDAGFSRSVKSNRFHHYGWVKLTPKLGKVYFKPDNEISTIYSIFGMFENVKNIDKAIINSFGMNQYSGKYNCHMYDSDSAIDWLKYSIQLIADYQQ